MLFMYIELDDKKRTDFLNKCLTEDFNGIYLLH